MRRQLILFVTVIALGLSAAPALAAGCFTATAPEAVMLPDGKLYPAGEIKICPVRQLTPVATLHELSIDGEDLGFFLGARARISGDTSGRPTVVFGRSGEGEALQLHSVSYSDGSQQHSFLARRIDRGRLPEVRTREAITPR